MNLALYYFILNQHCTLNNALHASVNIKLIFLMKRLTRVYKEIISVKNLISRRRRFFIMMV